MPPSLMLEIRGSSCFQIVHRQLLVNHLAVEPVHRCPDWLRLTEMDLGSQQIYSQFSGILWINLLYHHINKWYFIKKRYC